MNPATADRALSSTTGHARRSNDVSGVPIQVFEARTPDQFEAAFDAMKRERLPTGVLVLADATFWAHRARLHELRRQAPSAVDLGGRDWLDGGGLASYQVRLPRRSSGAPRRWSTPSSKGAKPAVTPFEQATKLELVVNLKSAKALGITVPQSLLVAADHVIE